MEVGGLDDSTIWTPAWDYVLVQTLAKLFLCGHATENLGSGHSLIDGKKVSCNLVFKVMEPVALFRNGSGVAAKSKLTILNER